jgi:hypothetical protein
LDQSVRTHKKLQYIVELAAAGLHHVIDTDDCIGNRLSILRAEQELWKIVKLQGADIYSLDIEVGKRVVDCWLLGRGTRCLYFAAAGISSRSRSGVSLRSHSGKLTLMNVPSRNARAVNMELLGNMTTSASVDYDRDILVLTSSDHRYFYAEFSDMSLTTLAAG